MATCSKPFNNVTCFRSQKESQWRPRDIAHCSNGASIMEFTSLPMPSAHVPFAARFDSCALAG
jgi:hypothetical protein